MWLFSAAFQERNADRVYKPHVRKTKKKKYPIERDGIKNENPESYYDFGEEIGRYESSVYLYCWMLDTVECIAVSSRLLLQRSCLILKIPLGFAVK